MNSVLRFVDRVFSIHIVCDHISVLIIRKRDGVNVPEIMTAKNPYDVTTFGAKVRTQNDRCGNTFDCGASL